VVHGLCRLNKSMLKKRSQINRPLSQRFAEDTGGTRNVIVWSSFAFAVLQSICTFFAAMNGLRVGIGISSCSCGGHGLRHRPLSRRLAAGPDDYSGRFRLGLEFVGALAYSAFASASGSELAPNDAKAKQTADGTDAARLIHRYADSGRSGGAAAFDLAAPPLGSSNRSLCAGYTCIPSKQEVAPKTD
jgi:hypothetical protein